MARARGTVGEVAKDVNTKQRSASAEMTLLAKVIASTTIPRTSARDLLKVAFSSEEEKGA